MFAKNQLFSSPTEKLINLRAVHRIMITTFICAFTIAVMFVSNNYLQTGKNRVIRIGIVLTVQK
jgi:hypothetical protein